MAQLHYLGFSRIGPNRELKWATEAYWRGDSTAGELDQVGQQLRQTQWQQQRDDDAHLITLGDFAWYDLILETALNLNIVPARFRGHLPADRRDAVYRLARGHELKDGRQLHASPMRKWFDTNYHYFAPEWDAQTRPEARCQTLLEWLAEARVHSAATKVVLPGPLTLLWLSRFDGITWDEALERLLPAYQQLLATLKFNGAGWVQLDEPILCLDLPMDWRAAFERTYHQLANSGLPILLATYFGGLEDNLSLSLRLPVAALHIDLVSAPDQLEAVRDRLGPNRILSLGVVSGRNIWRSDLDSLARLLRPLQSELGDRLWVSSSCSFLHVPYDVTDEQQLTPEVRDHVAFACQKRQELVALVSHLNAAGDHPEPSLFAYNRRARERYLQAPSRQCAAVRERQKALAPDSRRRVVDIAGRRPIQQAALALPPLPTTTIGSFPQTDNLRAARKRFRRGELSARDYEQLLDATIRDTIARQEKLGLDVLVHGEPERTDMVEYFAERLRGFELTAHGWVQSYGTRCVKPPLITGDVAREQPLGLDWTLRAQRYTARPVKGMLTGPITLWAWSFPREDLPAPAITEQIALSLQDEVLSLEASGIGIIQIDEPALREKLPLRRQRQVDYLQWATAAFRLASAPVQPQTQIHTHMCYSRFEDIITAIAELDADVVTIEAARTYGELVERLEQTPLASDLGPGVYDIHSPLLPSVTQLQARIRTLLAALPAERFWINPDCGLKTRNWDEVHQALGAMVAAAQAVREELVVPA